MKEYALQDVFAALYGREDPVKSDLSKVFKSKKVQQLWEKAKLAGYSGKLKFILFLILHQKIYNHYYFPNQYLTSANSLQSCIYETPIM